MVLFSSAIVVSLLLWGQTQEGFDGKIVLVHFHFWEISFSTEGKFTNLHILIAFVSVVSVFICQKETGRGRWASTNGLEEGE